MQFDNIIGFIIFIVIIVLSIAQKAMEQAKAKRRLNQAKRESGGAPRRGGVAVDDIPVALPRAEPGRRARPGNQRPQIEDVIRRLMGEAGGETTEGPLARNEESGEGEEGGEGTWKPLPPPVPRQAPTHVQKSVPLLGRRQAPTPYQKPAPRQALAPTQRPAPQQGPSQKPLKAQPLRPAAPPPRHRPTVGPATNVGQPRAIRESEEFLPIEIEQRENERRWREEMEQRKKHQKPQTPQRQPEVLHSRARLMPARRRLFHTAGDVRRAIILSEVLGLPRAMRDFEERG